MVMMSHHLALVGAIATSVVAGKVQVPLSDNGAASEYKCDDVPYKMHVFNKSPLVIYIENFITPDERAHLQHLA